MNKYEVVVANVGTVYVGDSKDRAYWEYGAYTKMSIDGVGRCAHENVTIFEDGEPIQEYIWEPPLRDVNISVAAWEWLCPTCGTYNRNHTFPRHPVCFNCDGKFEPVIPALSDII